MSSLIDISINRMIFFVRAHMLKRLKRMLFIASAQKSIKKQKYCLFVNKIGILC